MTTLSLLAATLTKNEAGASAFPRFDFQTFTGVSGTSGGAGADGGFGEEGLLAEAVGDFGEFALVGTDGGQVIGLADEIEGAQGFPDLFVTGVHGSDLAPSRHSRSRGHGEGADTPADGGAHFGRLLAVFR